MNFKLILIVLAIVGLAQMAATQALILLYAGMQQPIPWQANEAARILAMFLALSALMTPRD